MLAGHSRNTASQLPNVLTAINIDGVSSIKSSRLLHALVFNQALPCITIEYLKPCTHFIKPSWPLKCSLVCSSKYYSLCLERWHAKVKKLHKNNVIEDRSGERDHWNFATGYSPTLQTRPPSTKLHTLPPASCWTQTDLGVKMPGSNPSPQVSLARLLHPSPLSHPQNWDNATHMLEVSEDIIKFCTSTGVGSSVTFTLKPSLTTLLFYLIATTPPSYTQPILLTRHHFSKHASPAHRLLICLWTASPHQSISSTKVEFVSALFTDLLPVPRIVPGT